MEYQVLTLGTAYELTQYLKKYFRNCGAELTDAITTSAALRLIAENIVHLIIVDLQAVKAGEYISFLSNLRKARITPILALTEHLSDTEKAQILAAGVDACLSRNCAPLLISAQAQALLRRYTQYNHYDQPETLEAIPFQCGDIFIDPLRRIVQVRGQSVELHSREFAMLLYFMRNPRIVLTSEQVCENAWGMEGSYNRGIAQPVRLLRKAIEPDPKNPIYIETVRRTGYRFTAHNSETCDIC